MILSVTRLTVGASQTGLSISETADLLEFAQADISTENELKENIQWAGRKGLVHVGGERRWIRLLSIVTDIHSLQPKNAEEHSKNNQKTHLLKHLLWYVSTLLLIVIMFRFLFTELFYFICCVLFFVSFFFFSNSLSPFIEIVYFI